MNDLGGRAASHPHRARDRDRHRGRRDPAVPDARSGSPSSRTAPRRPPGPASPTADLRTATDAILADLVFGPADFDVAGRRHAGPQRARAGAHARRPERVRGPVRRWPARLDRRPASSRAGAGTGRRPGVPSGAARSGCRSASSSSASSGWSPSTGCSRSSTRSSSRPGRTCSTRRPTGSSSSSRSSSGRRRRWSWAS